MSQLVKIKHILIISQEAVDSLFKIVQDAVAAPYASVEEQDAAIAKAKIDFETMLNLLAHKSFKAGKKVGKMQGSSTPKDVAVV